MAVQIELDDDAALVLFDLIASHEDLRAAFGLESPEIHALWQLEAALEHALVQPFSPNYAALLAKSRQSLVHRWGEIP